MTLFSLANASIRHGIPTNKKILAKADAQKVVLDETLETDQSVALARSLSTDEATFDGGITAVRPTLSHLVTSLSEAKEIEHTVLLAVSGIQVGRVLPLEKKRISIGRGNDNDIVLRDDSVSRYHAEIVFSDDGTAVLRDLGSTNGSFVNGSKIIQKEMELGSLLVFGINSAFKYSKSDQVDYEYQNHLYESNVKDPLTGAFNRRYLDLWLKSELSSSMRHGTPLSFLLVDLDHFKKVNDTYGHQTGDDVLKEVVGVIEETIRTEDVLARYGGEEFAVIASNTDSEGIQRLAERIRSAIVSCCVPIKGRDGVALKLTVSIGCSSATKESSCSTEDLVYRADAKLYEAKKCGRNRVR